MIHFILYFIFLVFTLSNAKHVESIVIGHAASSTSKSPPVKTMEPMFLIKVTNCSIQFGWILDRDGLAKNYMGSRPEAKKCDFFVWCARMNVWIDGWMDVWMDGCYRFFLSTIFSTPLNLLKWNWKPTISLTKWSTD